MILLRVVNLHSCTDIIANLFEMAKDEYVYETDASLNMYLGLHFSNSGVNEAVPPILPHQEAPLHGLNFPQRVASLLVQLSPKKTSMALDIGCAVGGSSFELAKTFDQVDAFDFSVSFAQAAKRMKDFEKVQFRVPIEADIHENVIAVHDNDVTQKVAAKVNFFVGDACRLEAMQKEGQLCTYDGVIMSNLLCRLPDPMTCLNDLPKIVNPGGVVVIVTPYSWLEEFTTRDRWLGGCYDNENAPVLSKEVLQKVMEGNEFEKIHEEQMPLIIREHQRKYQYIVSEATGWRRK